MLYRDMGNAMVFGEETEGLYLLAEGHPPAVCDDCIAAVSQHASERGDSRRLEGKLNGPCQAVRLLGPPDLTRRWRQWVNAGRVELFQSEGSQEARPTELASLLARQDAPAE